MTYSVNKLCRFALSIGVFLATSSACRTGADTQVSQANGPAVDLTSPMRGQVFPVGEPISVGSTSTDSDGVQRVELWVDETKVRVDNNPAEDSPYIVLQRWRSDIPGTHVIQVKAFDTLGAQGQSLPTVITLEVVGEKMPVLTRVVPVSATLIPEASSTPQATQPRVTQISPTSTPVPTAPVTSSSPMVICTPPLCQSGEVYHCPSECPGGCGTGCATPTPTLTPPSFEPTNINVHAIFKPIWEKPSVKDYLGYPTQQASDNRRYARQYFERGYLYWWDRSNGRGLIWAVEMPQLTTNQGSGWTGPYEDTWDGGDPHSCEAARATVNGPVAGFGNLWCADPEIAQAIGAAIEPERGTGESDIYAVVQFFQSGVMLYSPLDQQVFVLFDGGNWQRHTR